MTDTMRLNSTNTSQQQPFQFPQIHDFPPFYTKQPTETTWNEQKRLWSTIILDYCRYFKLYTLSPSSSPAMDTTQKSLFSNPKIDRSLRVEVIKEIFDYMVSRGEAEWINRDKNNSSGGFNNIGSTISSTVGNVIYGSDSTKDSSISAATTNNTGGDINGSGISGRVGDECLIYWRRPNQWADLLYNWVIENGLNNTIMTVFELVEGDDTQDQEFHKIDARLFKRCVDVLISRGKAQIISYSGNVGTAKENSISGLSGETGIKFF